jgi:E3 ubiquitin-protein ligase RGLG
VFAYEANASIFFEGEVSFNKRSLHGIGDRPNPYEKAILILRVVINSFSNSTYAQILPFIFHSDHSPCHGFEEVLICYKNIVPNLKDQ